MPPIAMRMVSRLIAVTQLRCAGARIAHSASTSDAIIASVCSGPGVKRSRSSPRGTVG